MRLAHGAQRAASAGDSASPRCSPRPNLSARTTPVSGGRYRYAATSDSQGGGRFRQAPQSGPGSVGAAPNIGRPQPRHAGDPGARTRGRQAAQSASGATHGSAAPQPTQPVGKTAASASPRRCNQTLVTFAA